MNSSGISVLGCLLFFLFAFRYFIEVIRTETVMTKTTDTDPAIIMPTVDKEILIFSVGDNVRAYLFTKKTRMTKH